MKRRDFLKTMSAVPAIAAVPSLAFSKAAGNDSGHIYIFGESTTEVSGNRLMTIDEITEEALKIAHDVIDKKPLI